MNGSGYKIKEEPKYEENPEKYMKKIIEKKMKEIGIPDRTEVKKKLEKMGIKNNAADELLNAKNYSYKILDSKETYNDRKLTNELKAIKKMLVKFGVINRKGKFILEKKQIGIKNGKPIYKNRVKKQNNYNNFISDAMKYDKMTLKQAAQTYSKLNEEEIRNWINQKKILRQNKKMQNILSIEAPPEMYPLDPNSPMIEQMKQKYYQLPREESELLPTDLTEGEFYAYPRSSKKNINDAQNLYNNYVSMSKQNRRIGRGGSQYSQFICNATRGGKMTMAQAAALWRNRH